MSSTSNAQDLLVNVFRPTYKWEAGTGFVPSLVISNVSELIASKIQTDVLVVSDSNVNTYIGGDAGINASNTLSNVGIGYSAMGGALNSDCNVAIGTFALDGLTDSDSNVAIGAGTDISGTGVRNILLGTNVTLTGGGSNNILIGVDLSRSAISNTLQIGKLLYGNLSNGYIGINTPTPMAALDISGDVVFRNKVGIQKENPDYSLDVAGTLYVSSQVLTGGGLASAPTYSFDSYRTSGVYRPTDASYGVGAIGVTISEFPRLVVTSNKTYIYGDLDICGALTASGGGGGGGGTIATNGSASAPSFTFSNDLSTGLHRGGTSILAFDTSGRQRMTLSNGFLGIGTATPRVALDVSGDISANVYNGPGGTAGAPHYTFSDDRTTGFFFPGANMVGFTAGGTERMRISNSNIGIGTTTPSNALDVAGTLRVIGVAGDITFSNGAIAIAGSNVISSTGVLSNGATTSNSIGGVILSNSNAIVGGSLRNATVPTTYDISGGNISNSGVHTTAGLVGTYLRNALIPTSYDISGGNISNSGTITASNVRASGGGMATPSYSFTGATGSGVYRATDTSYGTGAVGMSVGGQARLVVTSNKTYIYGDLDVCGAFSAASGGGGGGGGSGTVASNGTAGAPSFTFSNDNTTGLYLVGTSNLGFSTYGGTAMVLSNGVLKINPSGTFDPAATRLDVDGNVNLRGSAGGGNLDLVGRISNGQGSSNSIGGVTLSNGILSTPSFSLNGTTGDVTAVTFATTSPTSNVIGGVTLNAGAISNDANTNNSIGGITLAATSVGCSNITTNPYAPSSIGGVDFYDGALGVTGQYLVANTGAFSNGTGTSNSIGGITLSNGTLSGASNLEKTYYITSNQTLDFPFGYSKAHVTLCGGGGGGGGARSSPSNYAGGGGGSGYIVDYLFTNPASMTIVIGLGGAGGGAGANGTPGGYTTIARTNFPTCAARGGEGGYGDGVGPMGGTERGDGGAGAYGGGGGSSTGGQGVGGIGKLDDGYPGGYNSLLGQYTGGPGGGSTTPSIDMYYNSAGGCGGGPEGGIGGTPGSGTGNGGPGCGGGGGYTVFGTNYGGAAGGNGYCIVRFLV